ncbi:hypothetical protein PGT21_034163 [Puccinia graminis f. sp. tritici]|uniref:Uncharacterized protein n=2 Tax=Puccinia graminis f. sp. tritici TaxID=56615 RepID=A0A5B0M0I4_PUCGR|nr:hypothetical protein PGT21_034163 [Puccinia graminis f. sp. tritici]KAA1133240.1 hypothetical protein PGTUg99_011430 [Puccinia graminis f. sp. tritici]
MSDPARYPPPSHYRYPVHPNPASFALRPGIHPYYNHSPAGGLPNPALNDPANHNPTYATDEHYPFPPAVPPWPGLPPGGPVEHDYHWAHPPPRPYYGNLPGGVEPHLHMDQFANPMDQYHKRMKWREELLKGDPEKAINDNKSDASRLVVSLVTRGPVDQPYGQGHEFLFFGSLRKHPHYPPTPANVQFTCFALEASPIFPLNGGDVIPSALDMSKKSLTALMPKLDVAKDLKLVRKSKPLLWDNTTILETFLYRVVEGKEDPESAGGRDLAERLGPETHIWKLISAYHEIMEDVKSDVIATAIVSVYLPPYLSSGFDRILADQDSRADVLSLAALNVLYHCVTTQFAREAFLHYPIPPPPERQKDYELCDKRRVWAYWTEVIAWHLSQLREDAQVSTSYTLLKSLYNVRASVDDTKVSLNELEAIMINAIASEADRSRHATETLVHEGISECLHNPTFAPPENALEKMHIITAGTSSVIYQVIAKLITHVLARKPSLTESSSKSTVNRRIMDLKITIAESRPLSEGVTLAMRLSHVVDTYLEYRDRGSKHARQGSAPPSVADLGPSVLDPKLQAQMKQEMSAAEQLRSLHRLQPSSLGLSKLLADLDAKKEKKEPKVSIELITDAAVVSTVMAAGGTNVKPIILLGADRIFSNGDVVNKVGSAQMAWAGRSSGGIVLILCRADRIHSTGMAGPSKASSPSDQLTAAWEPTLGREMIAQLQKSSHVQISNPTFEDVNHDDITGYITELGFMGHDMLAEFSNMRSDLETLVWPENALTK